MKSIFDSYHVDDEWMDECRYIWHWPAADSENILNLLVEL